MAEKDMNELISALMDNELSELEFHRVLREMDSNEEVRRVWARYQMISASMRNEPPIAPEWDISSRVRQAIEHEPAQNLPKQKIVANQQQNLPDREFGNTGDVANDLSASKRDTKTSTVLSNISRFAVAASVTLAVIVGVQYKSSQDPTAIIAAGDSTYASNDAGNLHNAQTQPPLALRPPIQMSTVSSGNSKKVITSFAPSDPMEQTFTYPQQQNTSVSNVELKERLNSYMIRHAENASKNNGRGMMPFARVVHFEK